MKWEMVFGLGGEISLGLKLDPSILFWVFRRLTRLIPGKGLLLLMFILTLISRSRRGRRT